VFGWLFHKTLTREQAIAIATEFLAANGCRVVATKAEADWSAGCPSLAGAGWGRTS